MNEMMLSADVLAGAKFYARATAVRAIRGFIPEANPQADDDNWNRTHASTREHCISMVIAIAKAASLARLQNDDVVERAAADLWRAENPEKSVFECNMVTKENYRNRARANQNQNLHTIKKG